MPSYSMRIDVTAALRDLNRVVDRIAELIEWEKLAKQERRPHVPPSFQPADHFPEDMESLCNSLFSLDSSIHKLLDRPDLETSDEQREQWKRQLRQLEKRFGKLQFTAKLIRS